MLQIIYTLLTPLEGVSSTSGHVVPFLTQFWGCRSDINVTSLDSLGEEPDNTYTTYSCLRERPHPRTWAHPLEHPSRECLHLSAVVSDLVPSQYAFPLAEFRELA